MCNKCYFYMHDKEPISCDCECKETEDWAADLFSWYSRRKKCDHFIRTKYY
jgi:hypothetical protein